MKKIRMQLCLTIDKIAVNENGTCDDKTRRLVDELVLLVAIEAHLVHPAACLFILSDISIKPVLFSRQNGRIYTVIK